MSKHKRYNQLGAYVNSDYFAAANALSGKKNCRKVVAYVESYDDVFFWRSILSQLETEQLKFTITLPSRDKKLERGKRAALMSALKNNVGPDMIACVDADYDYLRQGASVASQVLINNPYVFHTYTYSIENLQCWAPALRDVCVMATLNDTPNIIDFEEFMTSYSTIIYPLFLWSVLCARDSKYGKFSISDFMLVVKTGAISRSNVIAVLKRVGEKVNTQLRRLKSSASDSTLAAYDALNRELQQLGIAPAETYLYVQGHQLFNETVVPMLTNICNELIRQREGEISRQSKHSTQRKNELSCYEHSIESVTSMLKKHTRYLRAPQVARIIADLKKYINPDGDNSLYSRANQSN